MPTYPAYRSPTPRRHRFTDPIHGASRTFSDTVNRAYTNANRIDFPTYEAPTAARQSHAVLKGDDDMYAACYRYHGQHENRPWPQTSFYHEEVSSPADRPQVYRPATEGWVYPLWRHTFRRNDSAPRRVDEVLLRHPDQYFTHRLEHRWTTRELCDVDKPVPGYGPQRSWRTLPMAQGDNGSFLATAELMPKILDRTERRPL